MEKATQFFRLLAAILTATAAGIALHKRIQEETADGLNKATDALADRLAGSMSKMFTGQEATGRSWVDDPDDQRARKSD